MRQRVRRVMIAALLGLSLAAGAAWAAHVAQVAQHAAPLQVAGDDPGGDPGGGG
jgi:hypothetical protein